MKEFKTLRISPENEVGWLEYMENHNWHLDNRQEVYNKSEHIVGMSTQATFKRPDYWGNVEGKEETTVQTAQDVTHYISLTFSRETDTKNHKQIVELEAEQENFRYSPPQKLKKLPKYKRCAFIFGFFGLAIFSAKQGNKLIPGYMIVGSLLLLVSIYCLVCIFTKRKQKIELLNAEIQESNNIQEEIERKEYQAICDKLDVLLKEERAELQERGLYR